MNPNFDHTRHIDIPRDPETGRMRLDLLPPDDLAELLRRLDEADKDCAQMLASRIEPTGFSFDPRPVDYAEARWFIYLL